MLRTSSEGGGGGVWWGEVWIEGGFGRWDMLPVEVLRTFCLQCNK